MLVHGGIYPVHLAMKSFGNFLVDMGYPEERIRDPYDGTWSHSPYEDAERLAGIARLVLRTGRHAADDHRSQPGGHAGGQDPARPLQRRLRRARSRVEPPHRFSPRSGAFHRRSAYRGSSNRWWACAVAYVSRSARAAPRSCCPINGASSASCRTIPDTVDEFVGYSIALDMWAWTVPGVDATRKFTNGGQVNIRNVTFDVENSHVIVPLSPAPRPATRRMARVDRGVRAESTVPPPPNVRDKPAGRPTCGGQRAGSIWVIEAQRLHPCPRAGANPP